MQLISSVLLLLISTILIEAQDDGAPSNKCDPGTFPTEVISQGGQLFLFCHPAPTCAALAQGAGSCTETWAVSCASTQYVGAIRNDGLDEKKTAKYSVQCCQHPKITAANIIKVTNKFLAADDSFVEEVSDNTLQIISNIYDMENGKHIAQTSKIRCA